MLGLGSVLSIGGDPLRLILNFILNRNVPASRLLSSSDRLENVGRKKRRGDDGEKGEKGEKERSRIFCKT